MVASWIVLAGPVLHLPAAALSPPLFVATFEWLPRAERTAVLGCRQWAVTATAAALGVILAHLIDPPWVGGVAALGATWAAMAVTDTVHPPALAVALIPQITGADHPARFVAAVAVGAALLYSTASAFHYLAVRPFPPETVE